MFYVIQIDPATGHLLGTDERAARAGNPRGIPFETLEAAKAHCLEQLSAHPDTERVVFDEADRTRALAHLRDEAYWKRDASSPPRRPGLWLRIRGRLGF